MIACAFDSSGRCSLYLASKKASITGHSTERGNSKMFFKFTTDQSKSFLISISFLIAVLPVTARAATNVDQFNSTLAKKNRVILEQQNEILKIQQENGKLRALVRELQQVVKTLPEIELYRSVSKAELTVQESPSEIPVVAADSEQTGETTPGWRGSFTPRMALRFTTFHDFTDNTSQQTTIEEANLWTNGATFSVTTPWLPNTSFLFTGLYGQDDGKAIFLVTVPTPNGTLAIAEKSKTNTEVFDFEFLARTNIKGTDANWIAGIQYINTAINFKLTPGILFGTRGQLSSEFYIVKGGFGGFFNTSENGQHRIFSNFLVSGGINRFQSNFIEDDTFGVVGVDVNIGYEWIINPSFSISTRYRSQLIYNFGGKTNNSINNAFFVYHGPELHFTTRF